MVLINLDLNFYVGDQKLNYNLEWPNSAETLQLSATL